MKPYIYGARNGIYIIDLQKTFQMFNEASRFVRDVRARGRSVLFVGTKRQAQDIVREESTRLRPVLRKPPLAGRHPDQPEDDPAECGKAQAPRGTEGQGLL